MAYFLWGLNFSARWFPQRASVTQLSLSGIGRPNDYAIAIGRHLRSTTQKDFRVVSARINNVLVCLLLPKLEGVGD